MSSDPLEDAKLRLEAAKRQIQDLDAAVARFFAPQPYYFYEDVQSKPGRILHWVKLFEPLPKGWKLDVAAIAGNLRSPLDYAVNAVANRLNRAFPRLTFPIVPTPKALEEEIKTRKIKAVSPDLADIIRSGRPFDPDLGGNGLLVGLNQLNNSEKHRTLSFIGWLLTG